MLFRSFIGGATTSALHTAVKLAPLYQHVFYAQDASSSAVMAKRCMMDREKFEAAEHEAQKKQQAMYESMMAKRTMQESDVPEAAFSEDSYLTPEEYSLCDIPAMELSIDEILPYFDWRMFLAIWGIKYGGDLPDDPIIEKTVKDGKAVLERFKTRHEVIIRLSERIMNARREGNDIVISGESTRFPMLRQENIDAHGGSRLSLADFVPSGHDGPMGDRKSTRLNSSH